MTPHKCWWWCHRITLLQPAQQRPGKRWSKTRFAPLARWRKCSPFYGVRMFTFTTISILKRCVYALLKISRFLSLVFFFSLFLSLYQGRKWERVDTEGSDPDRHVAQWSSVRGQTDPAEWWEFHTHAHTHTHTLTHSLLVHYLAHLLVLPSYFPLFLCCFSFFTHPSALVADSLCQSHNLAGAEDTNSLLVVCVCVCVQGRERDRRPCPVTGLHADKDAEVADDGLNMPLNLQILRCLSHTQTHTHTESNTHFFAAFPCAGGRWSPDGKLPSPFVPGTCDSTEACFSLHLFLPLPLFSLHILFPLDSVILSLFLSSFLSFLISAHSSATIEAIEAIETVKDAEGKISLVWM